VSPFTRDYKRYLYAVDQRDNPASIIVYDITDPVNSPHVPLTRPHSVLSPQLPLDRIQFTIPVATVAFASHDFPLTTDPSSGANIVGAAGSGLLCNPNPNVNLSEVIDAATQFVVDASFTDPGAFYRNNFTVEQVPLGPSRLRGIFGFATLTNGEVMLIDVDDWDSPCRRPVSMSGFTSDIAPPEQATPESGPFSGPSNPLDPYQVPEAGSTNGTFWVTNETFFPSSQPHRPRAQYPYDLDPLLGIHYPQVQVQPQLFNIVTGSGLPAGTEAGDPTILPTATTLSDFSGYEGGAGVRLAWEDPLVHQNQSWNVTYEGTLPTFTAGIEAQLVVNPSDPVPYETLVVQIPGGLFCRRGVEDFSIGQQRVGAAITAAGELKLDPDSAFPPNMSQWVGDYVQISDELPPPSDPYWSTNPPGCFDGVTNQSARYQACYDYFQPLIQQYITRDFPILEAYDDHLVISRFSYPNDNPPPDAGPDAAASFPVPPLTTNRTVAGPDPSNIPYLHNMQCCFHNQSTINVRTGGEWVAVGSVSGLIHHVTTDPTSTPPNRCVLSCDPQQVLLNARNLGFYEATSTTTNTPDRNNALAMRNPMFAFFIQHPFLPDPNVSPQAGDGGTPLVVSRPPRDDVWQFALKGELAPLTVNLAATNNNISPQSMLFIPSLGQLAIVDGSQQGQGLILIDLNAVAVTGNTYY